MLITSSMYFDNYVIVPHSINSCFKRQIIGSRCDNGARVWSNFTFDLRDLDVRPSPLTTLVINPKILAILLSVENDTLTVFLSFLDPQVRAFKKTPYTRAAILDFSRTRVFAMGRFAVFFYVIICHQ